MSNKDSRFTSKDFLRQLHQTPDLAYEFTTMEVLEGVKYFLRYVGYSLSEEIAKKVKTKPDFYAKREEEVKEKSNL